MATIMSTGQITIVDLTDQRTSSFYLQANQSKIQTYNSNTGVFSPDYATANGKIEITPSFFFGNEDYSSSINGTIRYYVNDSETAATIIASSSSSSADYYQKGNNLYIQKNIGTNTLTGTILRVKAVIAENSIKDQKTQLYNTTIEATIEFARVNSGVDGDKGASVSKIEQQYLMSDSATTVPDNTDSNWGSTYEQWTTGKYLWIRTKITYSDPTATPSTWVEYTAPYCDSSWQAAADGVLSLSERIDGVDELLEALQKEVDGAIETWYMAGDPNKLSRYPWYDSSLTVQDTEAEHEGDLYFDTDSGKSYRFFKQQDGTYKWQVITDSELTQAMQDIQNLQTEVDGKVAIYYNETAPSVDSVHIDDLWIKPDGNFYQCTGTIVDGKETNKKWELASVSIDAVTVEYAEHTSNTVAPTSGWSASAPAWSPDKYVWQRTKTTFKDNAAQAIYSDPVCISAAAARGITVSGEQVFKSTDAGATYLPSSITLSALCTGGLTAGKWYYKNGTSWTATSTTGASFSITSGHAAFGTGTTATIKVESADGGYYDIISLYKVADGKNGTNGSSTSSVFLTNENITFAADKDGKVAATTVTCKVVAYTGTTKKTPTVGTISGAVTGMTVAKESATSNEIPIKITIAAGSTLGSTGITSGTLSVPITSPVNTTLTINWSKVNTGATGATGAAGANAVFGVVESVSGKVIFSNEDESNIALRATLYVGGTDTTATSYSWTSIPSGITKTGRDITVTRDDIAGARSFVCSMVYKGVTYKDSIAISDKVDSIYCVLESTAGDKFTNGNIETRLKCRVFDASLGEVDTAGTAYTYTWEKYVDGSKDTTWRTTGQVIGKEIEITDQDVTAKATFACTVTKA